MPSRLTPLLPLHPPFKLWASTVPPAIDFVRLFALVRFGPASSPPARQALGCASPSPASCLPPPPLHLFVFSQSHEMKCNTETCAAHQLHLEMGQTNKRKGQKLNSSSANLGFLVSTHTARVKTACCAVLCCVLTRGYARKQGKTKK